MAADGHIKLVRAWRGFDPRRLEQLQVDQPAVVAPCLSREVDHSEVVGDPSVVEKEFIAIFTSYAWPVGGLLIEDIWASLLWPSSSHEIDTRQEEPPFRKFSRLQNIPSLCQRSGLYYDLVQR